MRIKLPYIDSFDTLNLPDDFEDQVKESFKEYISNYYLKESLKKHNEGIEMGPYTEYIWKYKMLFIASLPVYFKSARLSDNDTLAKAGVKKLIHARLDHHLDYGDDILDREEVYSYEFMCQCFSNGMHCMNPLGNYEPYSSSKNDETQKVMFRIMQIVMNWEPEDEKQ